MFSFASTIVPGDLRLSLESCEEVGWLLMMSPISLGKFKQFHTGHHAHSGHWDWRAHTLEMLAIFFSLPRRMFQSLPAYFLYSFCLSCLGVHRWLGCSGWHPGRQSAQMAWMIWLASWEAEGRGELLTLHKFFWIMVFCRKGANGVWNAKASLLWTNYPKSVTIWLHTLQSKIETKFSYTKCEISLAMNMSIMGWINKCVKRKNPKKKK